MFMSCFGCQLANQTVDAKVVFEDEFIVCMLDIYPLNEGHTLILPKQHYKELDEIDEATMNSITKASVLITKLLRKVYNPDGITIMQNGGTFNDLDHYHMHIFPRYEDDGIGWLEPSQQSKIDLDIVKNLMIDNLGE
jgi:histidine triad (HIT) family protein